MKNYTISLSGYGYSLSTFPQLEGALIKFRDGSGTILKWDHLHVEETSKDGITKAVYMTRLYETNYLDHQKRYLENEEDIEALKNRFNCAKIISFIKKQEPGHKEAYLPLSAFSIEDLEINFIEYADVGLRLPILTDNTVFLDDWAEEITDTVLQADCDDKKAVIQEVSNLLAGMMVASGSNQFRCSSVTPA